MQAQKSETDLVLVPEVTTPKVEEPREAVLRRLRKKLVEIWQLGCRNLWEHLPTKAKEHLAKLPVIWNGFLINWRESSGFRLHWYADGLAFLLGVIFLVPWNAWFWLFAACTLKAMAEAFNTSHEKHADYEWPRKKYGSELVQNSKWAKDIKDSASYGVGMTVIFSLFVWAAIFTPEFWELLS